MKANSGGLVLVLVGVSLYPALGFAQAGPSLPSTPAIQAGPLSLYPSIVLHDIGTDSNVYNDSAVPKDDFTFTVTPRMEAALRFGITRLTGVSAADFVFYQTYKDQQSVNNSLAGRFEVVFPARLRPFVSVGRVKSRDRTGFEIDARALRLETNVMAGTDFELSSITALTAWAQHGDFTYGQGERFLGVELSDQLNHTSNLAAAGVKLSPTPLTTVILAGEVLQDRFKSSPLRNSDSVRVAPAIEFGTNGAITGRASAGYRQFKPVDPRLPEYRGFVASVGVGATVLGVTHFDVQANRDVMYSFIASEPYYLAFGGRVSVSQRILGPFDIIVSGSRQRLHYQALGGALLAGRLETTTSAGGGIGVHVGDRVRFTLTYDRAQRTSSEPGHRDYERRRMLGSVSLGL